MVEAAPKGTGLDCELPHDRPPQRVNHIRVTQLWAGKGRALGHISNGHNNGHTSQRICRRASANGQMSVSLLPSPGWPLPPLWWDSIPSWFGDPLGPTDRESDNHHPLMRSGPPFRFVGRHLPTWAELPFRPIYHALSLVIGKVGGKLSLLIKLWRKRCLWGHYIR